VLVRDGVDGTQDGTQGDTQGDTQGVTQSGTQDVTQGVTVELNRLSSRQKQIIQLIRDTPHISQTEMAKKLNVSRQTIYRDIAYLSSMKVIEREGAKKKGYWLIVELQ